MIVPPTDPQSSFNVWDYKPWWCQPWSIVLTGVGIVATSWLVLHTLWITVLVALLVGAWMGYFVLLYPRLVVAHLEQDALQPTEGEGE